MAKVISSSRAVEITVLSGENLQIDRRSIKKNAFVVVRSNGGSDFRSTEIDTNGGSNPNWNEKLVLEFPVQAAALTVEVYCKTMTGVRIVGTATVPISDFSGGYLPDNHLHFLSYRLRDRKSERNGTINLSVKTKFPAAPDYRSCANSSSSSKATVVGVPVGKHHSSDVVTGVPIWST
ncbi:BON1-associated protein 2-like [Humulus lupulus]|uniref:BON1-associated protein 2-like n=1 Tax=Humulus lupulus TaxID=3486 RepID=UPI002B406D2B|nr:BON1-associated protein 2-like [Humulus lupulus]XP_062102163.1 BON1-associated protein 2-like [Humulus lupulus]